MAENSRAMWPVRLGSWLIPRNQRPEWTSRHLSRHQAFHTLVDRGEIILTPEESAMLARETLSDAVATRVSPASLARWLQGPAFLTQAALALTIVAALASSGFSATRHLISLIRTVHFATGDPLQNAIVAHVVPMMFALMLGFVMAGYGRWPGGGHGCRYWAFLAFKTVASVGFVTLVWIEAVAKVHPTYNNPLSVLPPLLLTFFYIASFGYAVEWSFADQRARCPVCLNRLAMPVSLGSWGSILDPARTELVCGEGHGSLEMTEADTAQADQWTTMDGSWKTLFPQKVER